MGTPHMQKSSAYMVRRTARQMRVKLTACLEASHSHSSSPRQTPSAPVRQLPVASCQLSVASFQLPVAKVLTNQQQQQKHSSNISTAATPTQDIQGTPMWGSLDWSRSPAQFGAQPTRSVAAGALREISKKIYIYEK